MRNLKIYDLSFGKTIDFVIEYLLKGNEIAQHVKNYLDFSKGSFHAYSSDDINIESIYAFQYGGLIKADYENRKSNIVLTPNIDRELSENIFEKFKNLEIQILFEDVIQEPNDHDIEIHGAELCIINNHVNYLLKSVDEELFFEALKTTNAIWYSFFIITSGLSEVTNFSANNFQTMLQNIQHFFIGAYDGEGYISWTKHKE